MWTSTSGICYYRAEQCCEKLCHLASGISGVVFATTLRSSTERYVGHLFVVFATSPWSSTDLNFQPQVWLNATCTIITCWGL